MKEQGICPHCKKSFNIESYGYGLLCPKCHSRIDVFPDSDVWLDTPLGKIGISTDSLDSFGLSSGLSSLIFKTLKGVLKGGKK